MTCTFEDMRTTIRTAATTPTWKAIFASIGKSESLAYKFLRESKRAAEAKDRKSRYYFEYEGDWDWWAPGHIGRAKKLFASGFERKLLDASANDYLEVILNPSTMEPIQKKIPRYAHYSRERCIEEGLDPDVDIFEWERDPISGEVIQPLVPVYATRLVRSSAMLKVRAIASQLNAWSERTVSEQHHAGHIAVVHVAPARFVPRAIREQQGEEIVEGNFVEVREALPKPAESTRKDITELKAMVERLSDPNRVTSPNAPVKMADGTPLNNRAPADDLARAVNTPDSEDGNGSPKPAMSVAADKPRVAVRPPIAQPTVSQPPPYARRPNVEAQRTSAQGGNLNRSIRR